MIVSLFAAVVLGALIAGAVLGHRTAVARRTYRDARSTTRAARALWRQVPRDVGHVVRVGAVIVALAVVAVMGLRAGR